jgi:hypothetical protein
MVNCVVLGFWLFTTCPPLSSLSFPRINSSIQQFAKFQGVGASLRQTYVRKCP